MSEENERLYDVFVRAGIDAGLPDRVVADSVRGTTTASVRRYRWSIGAFRKRGGSRPRRKEGKTS